MCVLGTRWQMEDEVLGGRGGIWVVGHWVLGGSSGTYLIHGGSSGIWALGIQGVGPGGTSLFFL